MAQNVTVYGIIDAAGYSERKVDAGNGDNTTGASTKTTGIANASGLSSSRLGFRGTEDLGGGMKANFLLESGLDTNTNATMMTSTRQAWAGLSGGFGEVRIGRQDTLGKSMIDNHTAFGGGASYNQGSAINTVFGNSTAGQQTTEATAMRATIDRHSNTLTYMTPTMNGLKASVQAFRKTSDASNVEGKNSAAVNSAVTTSGIFAAQNQTPRSADGYAARADYTLGGLTLAVAYTDMDNQIESATVPAKNKLELTQVGATYTMGAVKVFVVYGDGEFQAEGDNASKNKAYDLGLTYTMGATTLLASYGKGDTKTADGVKTDATGYQLQARYDLSKRTTAYVLYHASNLETAGGVDTDDKVAAVGIRHSF